MVVTLVAVLVAIRVIVMMVVVKCLRYSSFSFTPSFCFFLFEWKMIHGYLPTYLHTFLHTYRPESKARERPADGRSAADSRVSMLNKQIKDLGKKRSNQLRAQNANVNGN